MLQYVEKDGAAPIIGMVLRMAVVDTITEVFTRMVITMAVTHMEIASGIIITTNIGGSVFLVLTQLSLNTEEMVSAMGIGAGLVRG